MPINLQGFLLGNPWTSPYFDNHGSLSFWLANSLVPIDVYNGILQNCNLSGIGSLSASVMTAGRLRALQDDENDPCNTFQNTAFNGMGNIDYTYIIGDECSSQVLSARAPHCTPLLAGQGKGLRRNV